MRGALECFVLSRGANNGIVSLSYPHNLQGSHAWDRNIYLRQAGSMARPRWSANPPRSQLNDQRAQTHINHPSVMTTVIALTQLVLITFGTIFLKGIVNANGDITSSVYFQFLDKNWPWFFLIPVAWIAYTQISYRINKGPFTLTVARVTGIVLSGICLIYFASVIFFPSA
jgi:hypothetical protein